MDIVLLLRIYPVLESIASQLEFYDLLSLSRTNTVFRALLHGYATPEANLKYIPDSNVRAELHLGAKSTPLWSHLKSLCLTSCAEPTHTRGDPPRGCRLCGMPICTACVVKASFKKNENTFANRRRQLCEECWTSGNPHYERLHYCSDTAVVLVYGKMALCRCSANDGHLCSQCRNEQNRAMNPRGPRTCSGKDCINILIRDDQGGRVCLWCNLPLPSTTARRSLNSFLRGIEGPYMESTVTPAILPPQRWHGLRFADQRYPGPPILRPNSSRPQQVLPSSEDAPPYEQHKSDLEFTEGNSGPISSNTQPAQSPQELPIEPDETAQLDFGQACLQALDQLTESSSRK